MSFPAKKTSVGPYNDDTLGRMFARNAALMRLLICSRKFMHLIPTTGMGAAEAMEFVNMVKEIDDYHKRQR